METLYLRHDVKSEPLINDWYAWSFLVSPITFGFVIRNLHLRVLESYLRAPDQHRKAVQNRALRGGLFVDHDGAIEQIEDLVARTKSELADLIDLSCDIERFETDLIQRANGASLAEFYGLLPDSLRGRVELSYDLDNRPRLRFIEKLFYSSAYYNRTIQCMDLSRIDGDARRFVLSSPRFGSENSVRIARSFDDPLFDVFYSMRRRPQSLDFVQDILDWDSLSPNQQRTALDLFSNEPDPSPHGRISDPREVRFTYFGHATVLIETSRVAILTDPIISYDNPGGVSRFSYKDLPEVINYVVITHNHQDHVMFETLLQMRHCIENIVVPGNSGGELQDMSLKQMLSAVGFKNVIELREFDTIEVDGGEITGLPFLGEHGDLSILSKLAVHVRLHDESYVFAADSNNLDPTLYKHLSQELGELDNLFIGMECAGAPQSWVYGPLFKTPLKHSQDNSRRLDGSNCERAMALVDELRPKNVFVYAMGAEPWLEFISSIDYDETSTPIVESNEFVARCKEQGIAAERLFGKKQISAFGGDRRNVRMRHAHRT